MTCDGTDALVQKVKSIPVPWKAFHVHEQRTDLAES